MADRRFVRNVNDWPLAHFWVDPRERQHSKLLGWFLDPTAEHGCGTFLLGSLLGFLQERGILPDDRLFPPAGCRVIAETDDMDLRVERDHPERFAVLVENKVKGASDQPKQLSRYAGKLLAKGFKPEEIFVLYAPPNPGREPAADDQAALKALGVGWQSAPFSDLFLPWLEAVLGGSEAGGPEPDGADTLGRAMRENLSHYRNLLSYLVNQGKKQRMDHEILQQLRQAKTLPTLKEVEDLSTAVGELRDCLQASLRGKLLRRVHQLLQDRGEKTRLEDCEGKEVSASPNAEFDAAFLKEVNLFLPVNGAVDVGFGGEESTGQIFWSGYFRAGGSPAEQKKLEAVIPEADPKDKYWYAVYYDAQINYANCSEDRTAVAVMTKLIDMRENLLQRFKGTGGPSR